MEPLHTWTMRTRVRSLKSVWKRLQNAIVLFDWSLARLSFCVSCDKNFLISNKCRGTINRYQTWEPLIWYIVQTHLAFKSTTRGKILLQNRMVFEIDVILRPCKRLRGNYWFQVLLRGSKLRNTAWICGLVVYTGEPSTETLKMRLWSY